MSDLPQVGHDRTLRAELERLQHECKSLRAELAEPHSPTFLQARNSLQQQLVDEAPTLVREEKAATAAEAKEADLTRAIALARVELTAAAQRQISPLLGILPVLAYFFVLAGVMRGGPPLDVLKSRGISQVLAILSTFGAGAVLGRKVWPVRAPTPRAVGSALATHLLFNASVWAPIPLVGAMVLLIACGANLSHLRLLSFVDLAWCQGLALIAFALARETLSARIESHRPLARVEVLVAGAILLGTTLWGGALITNAWFNGGGLVTRVALGVVVAIPLAAALAWSWVLRGERPRPFGLWLVPAVISLGASGLFAVNAAGAGQGPLDVPDQVLTHVASEAPRAPPVLLRDEADHLFAEFERRNAQRVFDEPPVGKPGSREDRATGKSSRRTALEDLAGEQAVVELRRSFDVSAFLLAVQLALVAVLGAWLFRGDRSRRWLLIAVGLAPVMIGAAVLVRGG